MPPCIYNNSNPHLTDNLLKDITQNFFNQARLCKNTSIKSCFDDMGVIDTKKKLNAYSNLSNILDEEELKLTVNIERSRTEELKLSLSLVFILKMVFIHMR